MRPLFTLIFGCQIEKLPASISHSSGEPLAEGCASRGFTWWVSTHGMQRCHILPAFGGFLLVSSTHQKALVQWSAPFGQIRGMQWLIMGQTGRSALSKICLWSQGPHVYLRWSQQGSQSSWPQPHSMSHFTGGAKHVPIRQVCGSTVLAALWLGAEPGCVGQAGDCGVGAGGASPWQLFFCLTQFSLCDHKAPSERGWF